MIILLDVYKRQGWSSGRITGVSAGRTTIKVYSADSKKYVKFYVTVTDSAKITNVKSVRVSKSSLSLKRGRSYQVKASVRPKTATTNDIDVYKRQRCSPTLKARPKIRQR